MNELVAQIRIVLEDADLVLGWTAAGAGGVAVPVCFHTVAAAEQAVFNSTCVHNLAVHLPRLKDKTVGIVAKSCDARSVVELIAEREIEPGRVRVIGVDCPGMLDVKAIWRRFGYGEPLADEGGTLRVTGEPQDREKYLQANCYGCDEIAGGSSATRAHPLRLEFNAMTAAERRDFWREQYSRCIRCYACREACPMCYCRDACIMQTRDPHWIGGGVNTHEAGMMQLIRVNHLAGRCTGCGECERACPVGIPLMLLMEEQNRAVEEMFGYRAGMDPAAKPPLLTFDINSDNWGEK